MSASATPVDEATQAVKALLDGWYTRFVPEKSPDLLPVKSGNGWPSTPDTPPAALPPHTTLGQASLPSGRWAHVHRVVPNTSADDSVRIIVEFSQPTRQHPVPTATASVQFTYSRKGADQPSIRMQIEGQSHVQVLVPSAKDKNVWVRQGTSENITGMNIFKWCTEVIRSKQMVHDGPYSEICKAVFPGSSRIEAK